MRATGYTVFERASMTRGSSFDGHGCGIWLFYQAGSDSLRKASLVVRVSMSKGTCSVVGVKLPLVLG